MNNPVVVLMLSVLICTLGACKQSDPEVEPIIKPPVVTIDSVCIIPVLDTLLMLEQEVQLTALVKKSDGVIDSNYLLNWYSNDSSILFVDSSGLIKGLSGGMAFAIASAGGKSDSVEFHIIDLTGTWIGGVAPDTVRYIITQTGTNVSGVFKSLFGFPPITNVKQGDLTGSLAFPTYNHIMQLVTENMCTMRVIGSHTVQIQLNGELMLKGGKGRINSPNCSMSGTIDHADLHRE